MLFEPNCGYHLYIFYAENVNFYFRSKIADKLTKKLRNLMAVCRENLEHAQKLQKQVIIKEPSLEATSLAMFIVKKFF